MTKVVHWSSVILR